MEGSMGSIERVSAKGYVVSTPGGESGYIPATREDGPGTVSDVEVTVGGPDAARALAAALVRWADDHDGTSMVRKVKARKAAVRFDSAADARAVLVETMGVPAGKWRYLAHEVASAGYCPFVLDGVNYSLSVTRDGREWRLEDVTEGSVDRADVDPIMYLTDAILAVTGDNEYDGVITRAMALYYQSTELAGAARCRARGATGDTEFMAEVRRLVA
jgi:hypothetical protein